MSLESLREFHHSPFRIFRAVNDRCLGRVRLRRHQGLHDRNMPDPSAVWVPPSHKATDDENSATTLAPDTTQASTLP